MRYPQIVIYETDGWIAGQVADLAREHSWMVREARQIESCLQLLRENRLSILLLQLDRRLADQMMLVQQVDELVPQCAVVVISDVKMENVQQRLDLAGLAYDLGAAYVLFPPLTRAVLEDLVFGLMGSQVNGPEEEA